MVLLYLCPARRDSEWGARGQVWRTAGMQAASLEDCHPYHTSPFRRSLRSRPRDKDLGASGLFGTMSPEAGRGLEDDQEGKKAD